MIKQCTNTDIFLNICDKLDEVKNPRITKNILYTYMVSGLINKDTFTYISYDKDKMNGCLVFKVTKDNTETTNALMLFIWIDSHYNLLKKFIDLAYQKAKESGAENMYFIINSEREKTMDRRVGKYGFKKDFSFYKKEVI